MRLVASLSLAAFLAGCGADGMPLRPAPNEKVGDGNVADAELEAEALKSESADNAPAASDAEAEDAGTGDEAEAASPVT